VSDDGTESEDAEAVDPGGDLDSVETEEPGGEEPTSD
jgi:hypothetical protein